MVSPKVLYISSECRVNWTNWTDWMIAKLAGTGPTTICFTKIHNLFENPKDWVDQYLFSHVNVNECLLWMTDNYRNASCQPTFLETSLLRFSHLFEKDSSRNYQESNLNWVMGKINSLLKCFDVRDQIGKRQSVSNII